MLEPMRQPKHAHELSALEAYDAEMQRELDERMAGRPTRQAQRQDQLLAVSRRQAQVDELDKGRREGHRTAAAQLQRAERPGVQR